MLVGRDRERAALDAASAAAAAGNGSLVVVSGPAGIGKSRLAAEAADLATAHGLEVVRSYAVDDPGAPALWPWLRLIRGWDGADALPTAEAGDAGARFAMFVAIADVLAARALVQPLLVILEDLHWADDTSRDLLRHVAPTVSALPLVLLVTLRGEPELVPDVALPLDGLSRSEVADLMPELIGRADPALAAAVHEGTGGNPLLVRLAAQDLSTGKDDSQAARPALRNLAAARLAVLDRPARRVVEAAAVLGERVVEDVLAAVVGRESVATELGAALSAGVLRRGPDGIAFEHALVRDAVYEQTADRPELHRRAGEALATWPGVPPGVVAGHFERADALEECRLWARRADDASRVASDHDGALRFARLAVRCDGGLGNDAAEDLVRLAEAEFLAGEVEASVETCVRAADLAWTEGRPDLIARAGLAIVGMGNPSLNRTVSEICERALRELPVTETALRARLLAQIAVGVAESEGGSRPADLAAQALEAADLSGDARAVVEALAARHIAIATPYSVVERLELGRRAIELGAASGRGIPAVWGHLWRADAAMQLGNLTEFDLELLEIDRVARTRNSVLARWHHHRWSATRCVLFGEFAEARAFDDAAFELALRSGETSLLSMRYAFRGQLAVLRGDVTENADGWEAGVRAAPPIPLVRISLPTQLAVAGRLEEARAAFEEFRDLPDTYPFGVRWSPTISQVGRCAVLLDDAEVARRVYELMLDTAGYYSGDGSGGIFTSGANARFLGELALTAGDAAAALEHHEAGEAMNLRVGARPFVALSRLGRAQALAALGRDPTEVALLRDVLVTEFARLDMPGPLRAAGQLAPAESPLSRRETEIATLVAQALSNKEIAERLVLSERTVESHVRSILTNLGFSTRTEIATWQVRAGR